MTNQTCESLGTVAAEVAMRSAAAYLQQHNADTQAINYSRLTEILRRATRAALSQALEDAREAFACRMDTIGVWTFQASFVIAGTTAAKEYLSTVN